MRGRGVFVVNMIPGQRVCVRAGAFNLARLHHSGDLRSAEAITGSLWTNINQIRGFLILLPWFDSDRVPGPRGGRLRAACSTRRLGGEAAGKLSSDIHTFIQFLSLLLCGDETGHIRFYGQFGIAN